MDDTFLFHLLPFLQSSITIQYNKKITIKKETGSSFTKKKSSFLLWWEEQDSNLRLSPCRGDTLPAELSSHRAVKPASLL